MKKRDESYPKVVVKKIIPAKREDVFEAWTNPDLIRRWFVPPNWTPKLKVDIKVGGKYSFDMISDGTEPWCKSDGDHKSTIHKDYLHTGEYLEIVRPEKLVFTWNSSFVQNTRVTVELREIDEATEVTVTHELISTEELRTRHAGGWELCLSNMTTLLS